MRVTQGLRRHPVLAVAAMQIAPEHSKAVGERARIDVKERFLLDGIALDAAHVAPRHAQRSPLVEPHLADADRALRNRAAMAARMASQTGQAGNAGAVLKLLRAQVPLRASVPRECP